MEKLFKICAKDSWPQFGKSLCNRETLLEWIKVDEILWIFLYSDLSTLSISAGKYKRRNMESYGRMLYGPYKKHEGQC